MKNWLACIFLCIFSFQVLPVKELGKLLFKGQMTEEIHECGAENGEGCGVKLKKGIEPYKLNAQDLAFTARIQYSEHEVMTAIHKAANLPQVHVPDILTPPPNFS